MGEDRLQKSEGTWGNWLWLWCLCVYIFMKISCAFNGYILFCELDFSKMYLKRKMFANMKVWQGCAVASPDTVPSAVSHSTLRPKAWWLPVNASRYPPYDPQFLFPKNKCSQECSQGLAPARLEATHLSVCRKIDKVCGVVVWQQDVWIWKYPEQKKWTDNRAQHYDCRTITWW